MRFGPINRWLRQLCEPAIFVNVLLCLATFALYWATRDLVHDAKDTSERQLRAYVILARNYKKIEDFELGKKPHIMTTIENVGQTPVYNGTWISGLNVLPNPLPGKFSYADCDIIMKQPDAKQWFFGKSADIDKERDREISAEEIKQLKEENYALFFHGRICYRDIFQKIRTTDFCMRFFLGRDTNESVRQKIAEISQH
jgi:hypothetical protein